MAYQSTETGANIDKAVDKANRLIDDNDVVQAIVEHRTGALTDLLNIADSANGEIAVATDFDALVVYGATGTGRVYSANAPDIFAVAATSGLAGVGYTTPVAMDLTNAVLDNNGIADLTNNLFLLPVINDDGTDKIPLYIKATVSGTYNDTDAESIVVTLDSTFGGGFTLAGTKVAATYDASIAADKSFNVVIGNTPNPALINGQDIYISVRLLNGTTTSDITLTIMMEYYY